MGGDVARADGVQVEFVFGEADHLCAVFDFEGDAHHPQRIGHVEEDEGVAFRGGAAFENVNPLNQGVQVQVVFGVEEKGEDFLRRGLDGEGLLIGEGFGHRRIVHGEGTNVKTIRVPAGVSSQGAFHKDDAFHVLVFVHVHKFKAHPRVKLKRPFLLQTCVQFDAGVPGPASEGE